MADRTGELVTFSKDRQQWSNFKPMIYAAVLAVAVDTILTFVTRSPRSRMNIMQGVSVLFFAFVTYALMKNTSAADSSQRPDRESIVAPVLAILAGIAVWTTMLPYYFISDDFGLLYMSRRSLSELMWFLVRHGDGTFYRPLVFSSFAWDHAIWGMMPAGYHLTNLILHICAIAGLFVMLRQLGIKKQTAALTAALFAAMPIQVESVAWMSGRFDVASAAFGAWTVAAYAWSRNRNNVAGYVLALGLYVLAICAKETGFVLPLLVIALELTVFKSRRPWPVWKLGGFLLTGGIALLYRVFAIGGIGGYQTNGGSPAANFSWRTFQALLLRAPSQMLFGLNWTQFSAITITTLAAGLAAILLLLAARAEWGTAERRVVQLALIWTFVTMIPAHFLLVIGPDLSNSRTLGLPAVGIAIVLGQLFGSMYNRRFGTIAFTAFIAMQNLGVLHNLEAWHWTSSLGEDTLRQIVAMEPAPPPDAQFVLSNLPDKIRGVYFFSASLDESLKLAYGRHDITAIHAEDSVAARPAQIHLKWKGKPGELLVRQDQPEPPPGP